MILNVSGRTDIIAFYSKWFIKRYQEGFIDVRNPIVPKLVSRINFKDVDLIVFCTKNPHPIIDFIPSINKSIIFQVTVTPYKSDIEPFVPDKHQVLDDIKNISQIIGKDNVYVRYDPIFLNDYYNLKYHYKAFKKLCSSLDGYITKIIISFIDDYKNVRKNMNVLKIKNLTFNDFKNIGLNFSRIAKMHGMTIQTCSEYNNLAEYGFLVDDCVSKELALKLTGKKYPKWHSRNNKYCHCASMVDIGSYNTCRHFCKYCYANYQEETILINNSGHNPNSSLLIGELNEDDVIKERVK
ncbi:MAG: DUF1848 domain-containing protein [Bacilli bacterium]|jgi:DNA repair photolyase|nr:DUF1848 domain-containing protein [Bacilli bacterium]